MASPVPSNKTPAKMNSDKVRGVVKRPIASSIARAQEEFKLFVTNPDDIDHNLYGRFLGILKGMPTPLLRHRFVHASTVPPCLIMCHLQMRGSHGRPNGCQSRERMRCTP